MRYESDVISKNIKRSQKIKKILIIILYIMLIPTILFSLLLICLELGNSGKFPSFLNINMEIYTISSKSMEPRLHVNDIIVVKKGYKNEEYKIGNIITYINKDGEYITHRIEKIVSADLQRAYITKGDKNNTEDMDDFVKKQTKQADFVLDSLKNKKVEYPVYFDLEAPNGVNLSSILTKEQVASMLEVWCTKMQQSGYIPGLYCNQSTFKYIQSCVDYKVADELQVWIAGGDQYYGETRDIDINDVVPSNVLDKEYGATMAQSTDSAINSGAGNHLGHIDVNFSTVDYTDQDIVYENDLYDIKEFERNDGELLAMFGGGATAGIAILAAGAIIGKKKKQKGTRNSYRPQQK